MVQSANFIIAPALGVIFGIGLLIFVTIPKEMPV